MKKALVVIQNKNNTAKKFGEEIYKFLVHRGLSAELIPLNNFDPNKLEGTDYILLSSWKNGSIFSPGHPDNEWLTFVSKLPTLKGVKTALFSTYNIFSRNIFKKMKKYLLEKTQNQIFNFKSKDGSLSISEKMSINDFIG